MTLLIALSFFITFNSNQAHAAAFYKTPIQDNLIEIDVVNDSFTAIKIGGMVNTDMYKKLKDLLSTLPEVTHIILNLNSIGGSNISGENIIELINEYKTKDFKFSTTVENGSQCLSMCIPIYMTGTTRYAGQRSIFMFHGASPWFTNIPNSKMTQAYIDLLINMGVSKVWLQKLIDEKVFSEPTEYWVTGEELFNEQSNIVTKVFPKIVKLAPQSAPPSVHLRPR